MTAMKRLFFPCPNCDNELESENQYYACSACKSKFIKIGETIFINETAILKAAKSHQKQSQTQHHSLEQKATENQNH